MDRTVDRLYRIKEELANGPVILETATTTTVIENLHEDRVIPIAQNTAIDHPRRQINGVVPGRWRLLGCPIHQRMGQAHVSRAIWPVQTGTERTTTPGVMTFVDHTFLIGHNRNVEAATIPLGDHRMVIRSNPITT